MKIKIDFVTNSSSSSFIVAWLFKIKSKDDVLKFISREDKAITVFNDSKKQTPKKITKAKKIIKLIAEKIDSGFSEDYDNIEKKFLKKNNITLSQLHKNNQWLHLLWDEQQKQTTKNSYDKAFSFIESNEGSYLYFYEYGDGDGKFFSEMEHGGTFKNLQHIRVSYH